MFEHWTLMLIGLTICTAFSTKTYAAKVSPTYQLGFGYGFESIQNQALTSRKQTNWLLEGLLGLKLGRFGLGLFVDYRTHVQTTDPAEIGGTDASGKSLHYGPAMRFRLSNKIFLSGVYFIQGNYSLLATTSTGQSVAYENPSGFRGIFSYRIKKKLFLDLGYTSLKYNKSSVGGTSYSIASDPIKSSVFELGFSLSN